MKKNIAPVKTKSKSRKKREPKPKPIKPPRVPEEVSDVIQNLITVFFETIAEFRQMPVEKLRVHYKDNGNFNSLNYPTQWKALKALSESFEKFDINPRLYFLWVLNHTRRKHPLKWWPSMFHSTTFIKRFADGIEIQKQFNTVVDAYELTCKTLGTHCRDLNITANDCIKKLISSGQFEIYIQSGIISKYWLSAFSENVLYNILKFISDPSAKEILKNIIKNRDKIYSDIYDAFLYRFDIEVNPIQRIEYYIINS